VPWARRAARTRDYLSLMKHLWTDDVPRYEGTHHSIPDCVFGPRPAQKPHPPIYFGGNSEPALRRIVEMGEGWYGHDMLPDEAGARLQRLHELLRRAGRPIEEVRTIMSPFFKPVTQDDLLRYRDLGFAEVLLPLVAQQRGALERRADELAALVRSLD